jgi:diadenylate cyclase
MNIIEYFTKFFNYAKNVFIQFNPFDAIDIILLTAVFFFAYKFLKSRKSGALLIGVGISLAALIVATLLNLDGIRFILSAIFENGVIVLIILLQPAIRDVLEKVGTGSLSGIMIFGDSKRKKQLYNAAIDNICAAVSDLSNTKTGALIAVVRTTKLDEIMHTGIVINADVNSFLLRNLFFNKAPLHDGAVIIDEARIAAAGCLLPLSRRTDVDSDLGTRHRAAIGLSETSDAVVIVVSEETGAISVPYDCTLTRNLNVDQLRRFLMKKLIRASHIEDTNDSVIKN